MKSCPRCGQAKSTDEFYRDNRAHDGLRSECRDCCNSANLTYKKNPSTWKPCTECGGNDRTPSGACRPCNRATTARGRTANPNRAEKYNALWENRNPERAALIHRVSARVRYAIQRGALVRATACEGCGASGGRIEAAHHDYQRPLDVQWLCVPCHRLWDAQQPKTAGLRSA